jgi:hypothetical protein
MHCGTKKRMKKRMGGHSDIGNEMARREMKYGGGMARDGLKKGGQPSYKHGECPKGKPC